MSPSAVIEPFIEVTPLTALEFDQIRKLAYERFGLDLRHGKEQLVSARLTKKIRELKFHSFREYYRHVMEDTSGAALVAMIDALTTNHTSFFREPAHFDFLKAAVLLELRDRERINIWCAASSTGEEAYSIAFTALDAFDFSILPKLRIIATDISTRVLATAEAGTYPAEKFDGFHPEQMRRYLLRGTGEWQDWYRIKKEIRGAIEFRRLNLNQPFSFAAPFPIIFCRNVMIYFDRPTRQTLVNRLFDCLEPGGYLFTGYSETLSGMDQRLTYVRPAIYCKGKPGAMRGRVGKKG
ncbi:MAG: protein-glutamate O-methyltransferase CheR [Acidobacteriaceae bacterium]|nr:protein-glutamate O-methyltransferase CheR [Acidobacteriaceae bacterium]MBV9442303.1 protein-glutamate O-methyltransferase CheR [Acidobacteriaceae bacterium]